MRLVYDQVCHQVMYDLDNWTAFMLMDILKVDVVCETAVVN